MLFKKYQPIMYNLESQFNELGIDSLPKKVARFEAMKLKQ